MASHDRCFAVYHDADLLVSAECKGQVAFDFARRSCNDWLDVAVTSVWLIRPLLCCENHWLSNYWKFYCFNDLVESCCDDYYLGGIINAVVEEYVSGQEIKERTDPVQRISSKIEDTFTNKEK